MLVLQFNTLSIATNTFATVNMSQAHCVFRRQPCGVGGRVDLSQSPLARSVALGWRVPYVVNLYSSANVRDDRSPLAFGMTPAREAESAGGMTKVPKAW